MDLVEKVFELFEDWNQGLLNYALNYQTTKPFKRQIEFERERTLSAV